jgi:hypothetical protein
MYAKILQPNGQSWLLIQAKTFHYSANSFGINLEDLEKQAEELYSNKPGPTPYGADNLLLEWVPEELLKDLRRIHSIDTFDSAEKVRCLWYKQVCESAPHSSCHIYNGVGKDNKMTQTIFFNYIIAEYEDGSHETIIFPTNAYICNDEGKTIAKIA